VRVCQCGGEAIDRECVSRWSGSVCVELRRSIVFEVMSGGRALEGEPS
jgi:hypothetical protein